MSVLAASIAVSSRQVHACYFTLRLICRCDRVSLIFDHSIVEGSYLPPLPPSTSPLSTGIAFVFRHLK